MIFLVYRLINTVSPTDLHQTYHSYKARLEYNS